ncbi:MAG: cellulose synthase catalytic subunit [Thermodesulfobacteriota bacterium]|nr:cellulose synthase catalytic subunit [Thermodesulfobacteriota bacterium]
MGNPWLIRRFFSVEGDYYPIMPTKLNRIIIYILVAVAAALSVNLIVYSAKQCIVLRLPFAASLLIGWFLLFVIPQLFFVWYLYCRFQKRDIPKATTGLRVDVFITAFNEPMWMVKRAVNASMHITYPHRTYLLDDSHDSAYKGLAKNLGSAYLNRDGNKDYKAGNINSALERTSGDFIVVFDIDHAPRPEFLDRTLGFFNDPLVGFVQVMETFCNSKENLMAQASTQTAMEYFNISLVCKDHIGAGSMHGTNAVIRRKALDSIGGYQPGLAEDLETSLSLHGHGWKSAYVCEPLAPGFSPATFNAFCKQQLKWSRGVFETAWRSVVSGTFFRLTLSQQLAYSVRFSYYIVGLSVLLGMVLTFSCLTILEAGFYEGFLARLLPLAAATMVIRWFMLRAWATEPDAKMGIQLKGTSLVFSTWPVYMLSLVCTIARISIPFMSTPKDSGFEMNQWTILPQIFMIAAMIIGIIWKIVHWQESPAPFTLITALLIVAQQWILFVLVWQSLRKPISGADYDRTRKKGGGPACSN